MADKLVRISDKEAAKMLEKMAEEDRRSEGNTVALLIRSEHDRRMSQRQLSPSITVLEPAQVE